MLNQLLNYQILKSFLFLFLFFIMIFSFEVKLAIVPGGGSWGSGGPWQTFCFANAEVELVES